MPFFEAENGHNFTNLALTDAAITQSRVQSADSAFPFPDDYQTLGAQELGFDTNAGNGTIDSDDFFNAPGAHGGTAIAILTDDGRILVGFRGSDSGLDLDAYLGFRDGSYIDAFESYMISVAAYAQENGYTIDLVTGFSLGGATTNLVANDPDFADGAYADAQFFATASPYIADNDAGANLYNFGFANDYAFEHYETNFDGGNIDHAGSTDDIVYYNSDYADTDWNPRFDFSSHGGTPIFGAIETLAISEFSEELTEDSQIIIGSNNQTDMQLAYDRSNWSDDDVYYLSSGSRQDDVTGTSQNDRIEVGEFNDIVRGNGGNDVIFGGGGADRLSGNGGRDEIHGGNWHDTIWGGSGSDELFGDAGDDKIYGGSGRDLLNGGDGNDRLFGGNGRDYLIGGEGDDQLVGGRDSDILVAGEGRDFLRGGDDSDLFVVGAGGRDTIVDFELNEDIIALDDSFTDALEDDGTSVVDHASTNNWGNTVITFDGRVIVIRGITVEELEADAQENDAIDSWDELLFV